MEIRLEIPDELAPVLAPVGKDAPRAALEAIGIDAYRRRRITGYQLRALLGIQSRQDFDKLLKDHEVEKYTVHDFEHDLATIQRAGGERRPERRR